MSLSIHTIESAPAPASAVLAGLKTEVGFVPNIAAAMANSPRLLEAFTMLRTVWGKTGLTPKDREAVSLTVHHQTQCGYGMAVHATFAQRAGMADADIAALRQGQPPKDPRLAALARFVMHVMGQRGRMAAEEVQALSQHLPEEQMLEVLVGIAMAWGASSTQSIAQVPIDTAFAANR
jgi:AhpD family alkylhydroperoxidase